MEMEKIHFEILKSMAGSISEDQRSKARRLTAVNISTP